MDISGQERLISLHSWLLKDEDVICFVYDITWKYSFEGIKNNWFHAAIQTGEKYSVLAIVGCKSDLNEELEVNLEEVRQFRNK